MLRFAVGIKTIDALEVRRGGVEPLAVDAEMAVVADLDFFVRQGDEPFDVKLILRHRIHQVVARVGIENPLRLEHDDFAAFRLAEIVSQPVHEQMIARIHAEFDDVVAFVINVAGVGIKPGAKHERADALSRRLAEIRRKPNPVFLPAHLDRLPEINDLDADRRIHFFKLSVGFRHDVNVAGSVKSLFDPLPEAGDFEVRIAVRRQIIFPRHAEQRRLHRAGGNLERLQKKSADGHRHGERDEQHLHVFAPRGVRIRLEIFLGGELQFLRLDVDAPGVAFGDGRAQFIQLGLNRADVRRRQDVALRREQPAVMLKHRPRIADGLGSEPAQNIHKLFLQPRMDTKEHDFKI